MRASFILPFGLSVLGLYACGGAPSDGVSAADPIDESEEALHSALGACHADTSPVAIATEGPNTIVTSVAANGPYIYYAVENTFAFVEPTDPPVRSYALRRVLKSGGTPQTIYSSTTEGVYPYGPLQFDAQRIYFSLVNGGTTRVVRMPKVGGAVTTLTNDWFDDPHLEPLFMFGNGPEGTLARMPKTGGTITSLYPIESFVLPVPTAGAYPTDSIAVDDGYVYGGGGFDSVVEGEKTGAYVLRAPKTGAAQPEFIAIVPPSATIKYGHNAHLLDVKNGKIYWADQERLVWRTNVNGSGAPNVVIDFATYYPDTQPFENRTGVIKIHDGKAIVMNGNMTPPVESRQIEIADVPLGGGAKQVLGIVNGNDTGQWHDHTTDASCVYVGSWGPTGAWVTRVKR